MKLSLSRTAARAAPSVELSLVSKVLHPARMRGASVVALVRLGDGLLGGVAGCIGSCSSRVEMHRASFVHDAQVAAALEGKLASARDK